MATPSSLTAPSVAAGPPTPSIRTVDLTWSDNPAVPIRRFPSLREADDALARAFATSPPATRGGLDETGFRVTWTDDRTHDGPVPVTPGSLEAAASRRGLLRAHLEDVARWLGSDRHTRSWHYHHADRDPDGLAERRAWGLELRHRLETDARAHVEHLAVRNVADRPDAPDAPAVPDLRATARASRWIAAMPSPPRLLPAPQDRFFELYRALQGAFDGRRVDWTDPRVNAFINYLTHALRTELPLLDAGDAAIIWWRWRDAVLGFQRHRTNDEDGDIYYRALTIARQVGYAIQTPGSVFQAFCPWRHLYFDRTSNLVAQQARRARLEVDPWDA